MASMAPSQSGRPKRDRPDVTRESHEVSKKRHHVQTHHYIVRDEEDDDGEPAKKGFSVWKSNLRTRENCDQYSLPATDSSGKHFTVKSLCIGRVVRIDEDNLLQEGNFSPEQVRKQVYVKLLKAGGKLKERMGFRIRNTQFLDPIEALCLMDYARLKLIREQETGIEASDNVDDKSYYTFQEGYSRLLELIDDFRLYRVYYDLFSRGYTLVQRRSWAESDSIIGSFSLYLRHQSKSTPSASPQYLVLVVDGEERFPAPQFFVSLSTYEEPLMLAVVAGIGTSIVYLKSNFESLAS